MSLPELLVEVRSWSESIDGKHVTIHFVVGSGPWKGFQAKTPKTRVIPKFFDSVAGTRSERLEEKTVQGVQELFTNLCRKSEELRLRVLVETVSGWHPSPTFVRLLKMEMLYLLLGDILPTPAPSLNLCQPLRGVIVFQQFCEELVPGLPTRLVALEASKDVGVNWDTSQWILCHYYYHCYNGIYHYLLRQ